MNANQARTTIDQILKTLATAAFPDTASAPATKPPNPFDKFDQKPQEQTTTPQQVAAVQTAGRVAVRRPDGSTTTIPAAHLNAALQSGYKQIP